MERPLKPDPAQATSLSCRPHLVITGLSASRAEFERMAVRIGVAQPFAPLNGPLL